MIKTEDFFSKRYGNKREKLFEILNNFSKAEDEGVIYPIKNINVSDEFLDFFSDKQELRSKFYFYLNTSTPPAFRDQYLENVESPNDILQKEKSKTKLIFKLIRSMSSTLKASGNEPSDVKDFVINLYNMAEEYASLVQPDEIKYSEMIYKQKEISGEIDNMNSYIKEAQEIKNEVDETLKEITKKMRTQAIDALTMTTLVFSAFTFLAVNAGIISGISQITIIDTPEMIKIFLIGNVTVLTGIAFILYLFKKIFNEK